MDEPKPLDSLFKEKIFRIPDYQRGYAWQPEQLRDFWEDLVNLAEGRSHYTGVLTLKELDLKTIHESEKEYWLVDDHSYRLYHIVDGQQRLTTFIIFLQAFVEFVRSLPENDGKPDAEVYITDSLSVAAVIEKYLYRVKPTGDRFRTYKFGYTADNPSDRYLRDRILNEDGGGSVPETFYTLNLSNAKVYLREQLTEMYEDEGITGLQEVYRKLTKRFLFNEYIIKDEFDVFVAFETMNNRGKQLSDLELLKNRLIYLTTLYSDHELDASERRSLRETINDAWKEVYYQLGRNKLRPLNDDDFLRAHWTMYFKYSRQTGRDYIRFLLDRKFTPQKVHRKIVREVKLEVAQEQPSDDAFEEDDNGSVEAEDNAEQLPTAELLPTEIRDYVLSLKESSVHWFNSFYPDLAEGMSHGERQWIDRLNRVGITYFRPLVMAILKNVEKRRKRIHVFQKIERFIFMGFRTSSLRANTASSEFNNAVRGVDRGEVTVKKIEKMLNDRLAFIVNKDGVFRSEDFYSALRKWFGSNVGYYQWPALQYFLYEYELSLLSESRQKKVDWGDLLKPGKDRISIEHIYPQTESDDWREAYSHLTEYQRSDYKASIGNLLLLSSSINSSLQNDGFDEKKKPKFGPDGKKLRNGYSDGSHSEIEVSQQEQWGPEQIRERGLKLLDFMAERWDFRFGNDEEKEKLLFLDEDWSGAS